MISYKDLPRKEMYGDEYMHTESRPLTIATANRSTKEISMHGSVWRIQSRDPFDSYRTK